MSRSRSFLAAITVSLLVMACGSSPGTTATAPSPTPSPSPLPTPSAIATKDMLISIDSTFIQSVPVGVSTDFDIDLQDVGSVDIPNLYLVFDAGDRFLDNYTIISAGSCVVDTNVAGLACGKVAIGTHLTFTIKATPKNTGDYVFKFHVDQYKTPLYEGNGTQYVYSWTQTVTA